MGAMAPQEVGTCTRAAAVVDGGMVGGGGRNCAGCDQVEGGGDLDPGRARSNIFVTAYMYCMSRLTV